MDTHDSRKGKITWVVIVLFFGLVIFGRELKHEDNKESQKKVATTHLPCKTIYKTIQDSENAIGLIGFELHEEDDYTDYNGTYPVFSVVMKSVDSQKDNYKSMCKDIIADVIKTCGDEQVIVNIYDSFEAYSLERVYERQGKLLSKEEEDTINDHRVATYAFSSECSGNNMYYLTFYPDANNGLRENEPYVQPDRYLP